MYTKLKEKHSNKAWKINNDNYLAGSNFLERQSRAEFVHWLFRAWIL